MTAAISALDKAAEKGIIHPNNAARRKSRLMTKVNAAHLLDGAESAPPPLPRSGPRPARRPSARRSLPRRPPRPLPARQPIGRGPRPARQRSPSPAPAASRPPRAVARRTRGRGLRSSPHAPATRRRGHEILADSLKRCSTSAATKASTGSTGVVHRRVRARPPPRSRPRPRCAAADRPPTRGQRATSGSASRGWKNSAKS